MSMALTDLNSKGAGYRSRGIMACIIKRDNISEEEVERLKQLQNDNYLLFFGHTIGQYATAALDITGAQKYEGKDEDMIRLIQVLKETYTPDTVINYDEDKTY